MNATTEDSGIVAKKIRCSRWGFQHKTVASISIFKILLLCMYLRFTNNAYPTATHIRTSNDNMPKISERKQLLYAIEEHVRMLIFFSVLEPIGSDAETLLYEEMDEYMDVMQNILAFRYLNSPVPVPRSAGVRNLLLQFGEREFRQQTRVCRASFTAILEAIEDHPIFHNNSAHKQRETYIQLAIALSRFGCFGNGASVGRVSRMDGVGAGTACLYTDRVIEALLSRQHDFIRWPSANRRRASSNYHNQEYGLPGCVGMLDGTYFVLDQKPAFSSSSYFTRKKRYSFNTQIVCDENYRIISVLQGWPGSCADSSIWSKSYIYGNPRLHLSPGEYLIADSGYALNPFCITPFKGNAALDRENAQFNGIFSSARVKVEHTIGQLKSRFQSLRGLRTQLRVAEDVEKINRWCTACCILHNIIVSQGDMWEEEPDAEGVLDEVARQERNAQALRARLRLPIPDGPQIRDQLKQNMLRNVH